MKNFNNSFVGLKLT